MDITQLRAELNEAQLEAVTYDDGPMLIVAGAGSGKTRVLTYKIAWLIDQVCEPYNILALTFTNKAAREMTERIAKLCGGEMRRGMWCGTFHSLFARMLRMESEATGFPSDFTIYDTADQRSLIKAIVKEMGLDEKLYKPAGVASRISAAKNRLVMPAQYTADADYMRRDRAEGVGRIADIYVRYQQRLRAASAMDFDDLLVHTYYLLKDHEEVRRRYMLRFSHILVDEYQDTNLAQHAILTLLTTPESHISVVGDDAQSIYGFRGADISNILGFKRQYPKARIVKLECNYRSTQLLVDAANGVIAHNREQIPKEVYAAGEQGDPIAILSGKSDKDEATQVVRQIMALKREGEQLSDIAVLYRTNAQSRALEEGLQRAGVPYKVYGGLSFYQRKEVKDVMAYLRLLVNHDDEEAFRRVINYPARGIGATTLSRLEAAAGRAGVSLWSAATDPHIYGTELKGAALKKVDAFCQLIGSYEEKLATETASAIAKSIIGASGILQDLSQDKTPENLARHENVDALLGAIEQVETEALQEEGRTMIPLSEYLSSVSLLTDRDEGDDGGERVSLMTIHAAKGLEYDTVFITGLEEGLFPNANAALYPREMEEERRLFYVALTRAKRHCFLTFAASRFRYGRLNFCEPSPFFSEVKESCIRRGDLNKLRMNAGFVDLEDTSSRFANPFGATRKQWADGNQPSFESRAGWGSSTSNAQTATQKRSERTGATSAAPTPMASASRIRSLGLRPAAATGKSDSNSPYKPGMRIDHERFGEGTITAIEGSGGSTKILVNFDKCGQKNLLVKFARFKIID